MLPQRDPLLVAKQAATIHHLKAGRFTLGIGVGYIAEEYSFLRADFMLPTNSEGRDQLRQMCDTLPKFEEYTLDRLQDELR